VELLCEELVIFRDKKGRVGALEAQEGQRSIAVHALENLATSDTGIAMLRHALREHSKRVRGARRPRSDERDTG
jgi:hypothetical protein